jgi:hypothetical protein
MNTDIRNPSVEQEDDRISWPSILFILSIAVLIGLLLGVWAFYGLKDRERPLRPSADFPERELGPRRQVGLVLEDIFREREGGRGRVLNERKRREISTFAWVDKNQRIVAIPIEQAMALLAEEGRQ